MNSRNQQPDHHELDREFEFFLKEREEMEEFFKCDTLAQMESYRQEISEKIRLEMAEETYDVNLHTKMTPSEVKVASHHDPTNTVTTI